MDMKVGKFARRSRKKEDGRRKRGHGYSQSAEGDKQMANSGWWGSAAATWAPCTATHPKQYHTSITVPQTDGWH